MAKVYPFRGIRYSTTRVPIQNVLTQPYDKISGEMQDRYYRLHPNNIIRIVLGKTTAQDSPDNNVYTRAEASLKEWRASGILEQIDKPAFFVYFQRFVIPGTRDVRTRKGFIGTAQLEDYANKVIYPHERTLTGPKRDRLELLRHTKMHFEQILMIYEDPALQIDQELDKVAAGQPDVQVEDEFGVVHTLWMVSDPPVMQFIERQLADKKLIIADGHHRYETALAYRDEMRARKGHVDSSAPFERMTMAFFNMDAPGLTILPTHRVLSNLPAFSAKPLFERASEFFDAAPGPDGADAVRSELMRRGERNLTIAVCTDSGRITMLTLKPSLDLAQQLPDLSEKQRRLDVVVLHRLLIETCMGISEEAVKKESHIAYVREMDAALRSVQSGKAQAAFLLNPTGLRQMRDIALEGNVMPQKSTDFYPKVLSGLMMYSLENGGFVDEPR